MSIHPLDFAAAITYGFRARRPDESVRAYHEALVTFVESRNYGAGHELRIGKPRAAWTPEDHETFRQRLTSRYSGGPSDFFRSPLTTIDSRVSSGHPVSDTTLQTEADIFLRFMRERREGSMTRQLPIMAAVLCTDGRLVMAFVSGEQRKAVLCGWIAVLPVFGYILVFDSYIHGVDLDPATGQATDSQTTDALTCHIGSRTGLRELRTWRYALVDGVVTFGDLAVTDKSTGGTGSHDPYADLFAVPASGIPQ